jgi:hypothetical protein
VVSRRARGWTKNRTKHTRCRASAVPLSFNVHRAIGGDRFSGEFRRIPQYASAYARKRRPRHVSCRESDPFEFREYLGSQPNASARPDVDDRRSCHSHFTTLSQLGHDLCAERPRRSAAIGGFSEYATAPSETATRLYLETMDEVLPRMDRTIAGADPKAVDLQFLRKK